MSRFSIKFKKEDIDSLTKEDISVLSSDLEITIRKFLDNLVRDEIQFMFRKDLTYHVVNFEKSYVIVINRNMNPVTTINIGYPFPLYSKEIQNINYDNYSVNFFIRNGKLRIFQRNNLIQCINNKFSIIEKRVYTEEQLFQEFQKASQFYIGKKMCYLDFYRFIGDSILGTYMLDQLINFFSPSKVKLFSTNYQHLKKWYICDDIDRINKIEDKFEILVFPDLMDVDHSMTMKIISNLSHISLVIILSRNMFIYTENEKTIVTYLDKGDILFNDRNIYDYMNLCLRPFISISIINKKRKVFKCEKIFINPYASLVMKTLSNEFCIEMIKNFIKSGYDVYIPYGHNQETIGMSEYFTRFGAKTIKTIDLSELSSALESDTIVISADSSIAHMASKDGLPCVVLFREGFYDEYSIQSLYNESPIGFMSYKYNNFPVIIDDNINNGLEIIMKLIGFLNGKYTFDIDDINSPYLDMGRITNKISEMGLKDIQEVALRIGSKYKINVLGGFQDDL